MLWAYPLALNNFQCFSSNSTKFSVVVENAVGFSYSCKSLTRRSHGSLLVGKCKMLHFQKSTKKFKLISNSFQKIRNMKCVWGTYFQPFNIWLYPFVTDMRSSWHNYRHLIIMHFSVKTIFVFSHQLAYTGPSSMWYAFESVAWNNHNYRCILCWN